MKSNGLLLFSAVCMFLCACTGSSEKKSKHGGYLRTNEFQKFKTLLPVEVDEINNYHIACQIYEGLFRFDNALQIEPALAKDWSLSGDKKTYTFTLRKDVSFHNDACFEKGLGRKVTVNDVKFCFEQLCTNTTFNRQFAVTFEGRVEGADEFFAKTNSELTGVQIINDSTLQIILLRPDANFLSVLAMAGCFIYPKEAWSKYGHEMAMHPVGTGPFTLKRIENNSYLTLVKNDSYWAKDESGLNLPYLDSICWSFESDRNVELDLFKKNKLDMIYRVPGKELKDLFDSQTGDSSRFDFEVFSAPALSVHFYGFNLQSNSPFQNKLVRRAVNLAIDREKIIEEVFKGEGLAADKGIVPYNVKFDNAGYPYKDLRGYIYNPDSAKKLIQLAGYSEKKRVPDLILDLNDGNGGKNILTAMKVQQMLKQNLDINVSLNIVPWSEHIDLVQNGKSEFFRYAWVCDYADPESFLTLFYGKNVPSDAKGRSYVNLSRFSDNNFDALFEAAKRAPDEKVRMRMLGMASQTLIDEAPFIPLYYDENIRVVKKQVHNLEENAMNYIDFRTVWMAN